MSECVSEWWREKARVDWKEIKGKKIRRIMSDLKLRVDQEWKSEELYTVDEILDTCCSKR